MLIGTFDGTNTTFFMTDGLGSVVASFSNTAGSAAVLGNQAYEPYGKSQYQQGSMGTSKGYTGQYTDNLSGLDYYGARYYDPVAGVFLSPDSVQGNESGMNPYAYVAGNPETLTDPTGQAVCAPDAPPNIDPCTTTTAGSTAAATAAATLSAAAIAAAVAAAFLIASSIAILITGWNYNVQQGWNSVHSTYYPKNGPDVQPAPTPTNPVVPPSYGSDPFVNNRDMPDDISTTVGLSLAPQPAPGGSGGGNVVPPPVASPSPDEPRRTDRDLFRNGKPSINRLLNTDLQENPQESGTCLPGRGMSTFDRSGIREAMERFKWQTKDEKGSLQILRAGSVLPDGFDMFDVPIEGGPPGHFEIGPTEEGMSMQQATDMLRNMPGWEPCRQSDLP
jgi:RHS repeat-associated protein